ncbi:hypothetical protein HDV63DRAFT_372280 [Trichoderma sp. SZMC 28014]
MALNVFAHIISTCSVTRNGQPARHAFGPMPSALDHRLRSSLSTMASMPQEQISVLRLSQEPRPNLTTVADRLAASLVRHLEHGSFLLTLGHIKFVPARVTVWSLHFC